MATVKNFINKAFPIGNYVSGPLKLNLNAEFSNKATKLRSITINIIVIILYVSDIIKFHNSEI